MTQNKRIIVNVLATYGRSVFSMACGLFTGRWILMALGEVDYGLYGVVGGLTAFIAFFNGLFASGVSRFYAFAVGASHKKGSETEGLHLCREWFNTAVLLHTAIPTIAILIGYPIGIWAVRNFLTIPPDRVEACVWVFRLVCINCFVGMASVPYRAMYTAKQEIAELTIYSFAQTIINVVVMYYMVSHPGDWLVGYAVFACLLSVVPNLIIMLRACMVYPECTFDRRLLWLPNRLKELTIFVAGYFWGAITGMAQYSGLSIIVNKFMGPRYNASMAVGNTVTSHTLSLSSALTGAFSPAVTNAAGEGDWDRMRTFALRACKFGAVLFLLFVIPAAIEVDELLALWLENPPPGAGFVCLFLMFGEFCEKISDGYSMAIFAEGHIGKYQLWIGNDCLLSVVIALVTLYFGMGLVGVALSIVVLKCFVIIIRLYWGRKVVAMSAWHWIKRVFIPVVGAMLPVIAIGLLPRFFLDASFLRVIYTTFACEVVFIPLVWFVVLDANERTYMANHLRTKFHLKEGGRAS